MDDPVCQAPFHGLLCVKIAVGGGLGKHIFHALSGVPGNDVGNGLAGLHQVSGNGVHLQGAAADAARYQRVVNLVSGIIVIVFGLNYLGLFRWNLFHGGSRVLDAQYMTFFSAALFGIIFSLGWTPCFGAFLGSALALAAQQGHILQGMSMLLCYSLGLGIPFLISAVLIDALKGAFGWVKRHYQIINLLSGSFLILIGLLMASGLLGRLLRLLG